MADKAALAVVQPDQGLATGQGHWWEFEQKVRELYAPHTSDLEWEVFKTESRSLGLDPTRREFIALAIGNEKVLDDRGRPVRDANGKDTWRKTYQGYITIHGARTLARRTGLYDSSETRFYDGKNQPYEVWISEEPPHAVAVTVYLVGNSGRGFTGISTRKDFRTFIDRKDGNTEKLVPMWQERPEVMMETRAEMRALRKAGLLSDYDVFERGLASVDQVTGQVVIALPDGGERARQSRKLHAIASGRGVDHEGARNAVQFVEPEVESLGEAALEDMAAAGDLIEVLDADGVSELTGVEVENVTGEPYEVVPEPSETGELATAEQLQYIRDNILAVPVADLTQRDRSIAEGKIASVLYSDADELVQKIARTLALKDQEATASDDSGEDWTQFWKDARAAGFANQAQLLRAAGVRAMPQGLEAARLLLDLTAKKTGGK